ncbi:MAG: hypothetical protein KDB18_08525 [Salinibacterium sp.]|nr:hypothetical protein [Salinibacterium sp.]
MSGFIGIEVDTLLRSPVGEFARIADVGSYSGDASHVPGAIELSVHGAVVLDRELWDDVDWLWPYVIQAIDECLAFGLGERYFPDQPIVFRVERIGDRRLMFTVQGGAIDRMVAADTAELLAAVAEAALDFFDHLERLVPGSEATFVEEIARVRSWAVQRGG